MAEKKFSKFAETLSPLTPEGARREPCSLRAPRTTPSFSVKEAIKFGWGVMKKNILFFIGLLIVAAVIYILPGLVISFLEQKRGSLLASTIVDIIDIVLGVIVTMGLIKIALNFCDGKQSRISDLFSQYKLFFRFLFATILYALITLGGLVLLIIPGIYWAVRLQFFRYFIIDKDSKIVDSLKRSWAITKGSFWNLFLLGVLLGLINLAGFILLLVGLFVTVPTTIVAVAFVYRKLLGHTEIVSVKETPAPASLPQTPPPPPTPPSFSSPPPAPPYSHGT